MVSTPCWVQGAVLEAENDLPGPAVVQPPYSSRARFDLLEDSFDTQDMPNTNDDHRAQRDSGLG